MAKEKRIVDDVHICFDRILSGKEKIRAMQLAIKENQKNQPIVPKLPGMSYHPLKMAMLTGKNWQPGRTLNICFLDGSSTQRERTTEHALGWLKYADIKFDFSASRAQSEIRITFKADPGSWSYIGTDNLGIPKNQPTMNFGWLEDDTEDQEYNRVVLHEFGHALGCIHEHQNPKGGIKWNEEAVYKYFGGPPNNWSKDEIYSNVIEKYSLDQLNASKFDPNSIMLYSFPGELTQSGTATHENDHLSVSDKRFIRKMYPKAK
jgi:hypothetical protein